ncbi:MAG: DEAD/DEAH box helicase [Acidobacteria bacterium]|nr:DEAD/DEAH box helicase [Acidobacteriota bacterium]
MNLSSSELIRLAETLNTSQLRQILSGPAETKSANRKKKAPVEDLSSALPRTLSKLNRMELIVELSIQAQDQPALAHRLVEAVELTPKQLRDWLEEREPKAPKAGLDKIVAVLTRSYQKGHHAAGVPALAVVQLLASGGINQVLKELIEFEKSAGAKAEESLDLHSLMLRRRRREELDQLLAGIGAPEVQPFRPDDFQLEAVDLVLNQDADVMVSAPTGSGKTWIAEQAIRGVLERGQSCWYTSPLKALSNDKFREFSRIFGPENVGIITGDRRVNPDAPLKIGTTEIYRNGLYDAMNGLGFSDRTLSQVRLVVFDEVHYLGDRERGVAWEESIIYTPPDARILMLSATVGNSQELADWVTWTRGVPCHLVYHPDRPVPLRTAFVHTLGRLQPLLSDQDGGTHLHADIIALYSNAFVELEARKNRRRPFYRRFK